MDVNHAGYLHPADKPVCAALAGFEKIFGGTQPKYIPLRAIESKTFERKVMSRWTLTPEQRLAIANGADIFLELLTFGNPLQPILISVADELNPDFVRHDYKLHQPEPIGVVAYHSAIEMPAKVS